MINRWVGDGVLHKEGLLHKERGGIVMGTIIQFREDPEFVEVHVTNEVRIAAEQAAIDSSKSVPEFMEGILANYLAKSGY